MIKQMDPKRPTLSLVKMVVLQIQGDAIGGRMPPVPTYVKDCDFDADDGRGRIIMTQNRSDAKRFALASEALEYWRTQSKVQPLRDDGRPNRPLTAYSVSILRDDQEPM